MFAGVPIGGRCTHGGAPRFPRLEAPSPEREGAQDLPPGFDQVQGGCIDRWEDQLPTRMCQAEQKHIIRMVRAQIIQDGIYPRMLWRYPALDPFQEIDPVDHGTSWIVLSEGFPRRRSKRAKNIPLAAPSIGELLFSSWWGTLMDGNGLLTREGFGRFRPPFVQTDHETARWRLRIESLNGPLFCAKSGSTRAPNQVSCCRQRKPSACKIS